MLPRQKWNYSEMKNMNYKFNKSVISLWIYGKEQIRAWKLKTKNSLLPPKTRLTISTTQGRRKLGRSETRGRGSSNVVGKKNFLFNLSCLPGTIVSLRSSKLFAFGLPHNSLRALYPGIPWSRPLWMLRATKSDPLPGLSFSSKRWLTISSANTLSHGSPGVLDRPLTTLLSKAVMR